MSNDTTDFPVRKLNGNISETLNFLLEKYSYMFSFSEGDSNKLLKSRIIEFDEFGWRSKELCEFDSGKNQVRISVAFCQMVWLLCYVGLLDVDYKIINHEFSIYDIDINKVLHLFEESNDVLKFRECTYLYSVLKEHDKSRQEAISILRKLYEAHERLDDEKYKKLKQISEEGLFPTFVNSVYIFAISFCLLHEFGHYLHGDDFSNPLLEETKADIFGISTLISEKLADFKQSPEFALTAFFCCLMYFGIRQGDHPDNDKRLEDVIKILKEKGKCSPKQNIFISSFLSLIADLKNYKIPDEIMKDENIDGILSFMKEKESK